VRGVRIEGDRLERDGRAVPDRLCGGRRAQPAPEFRPHGVARQEPRAEQHMHPGHRLEPKRARARSIDSVPGKPSGGQNRQKPHREPEQQKSEGVGRVHIGAALSAVRASPPWNQLSDAPVAKSNLAGKRPMPFPPTFRTNGRGLIVQNYGRPRQPTHPKILFQKLSVNFAGPGEPARQRSHAHTSPPCGRSTISSTTVFRESR
jgi:hypothetical protein